ncbi:MAG: thiamine phosphate synthase [Candidatus Binataceae bacterium]
MKLPSQFYAMVDPAGGHDPVELAEMLLAAGARILQLRLKDTPGRDFLLAARAIASRCRLRGAVFIVNDRVDIAILAGADGVHLGQTDLPLAPARELIGPGKTIGISTRNLAMARDAEAGGADYIGFGPMYPGGLKQTEIGQGLDNLRAVRAAVKIPIVAIGGITEASMPEVLAAGADAAAIITDVVKAPDISAKVRALLAIRNPEP